MKCQSLVSAKSKKNINLLSAELAQKVVKVNRGNIKWTRLLKNNKNNTLQKHAYSNILKTLQPKKGNFSIKNSDIFHISAQNID